MDCNTAQLYGSDFKCSVVDESDAALLDTVDGEGQDFELSSPIVSAASSFEEERFLKFKAEQGLSMDRMRLDYTMGMEPTAKRRKVESTLFSSEALLDFEDMNPWQGNVTKQEIENVLSSSQITSAQFEVRTDVEPMEEHISTIIAKRKLDHNSHTRKSREKLNDKFERLVSILPSASNEFEVKHKAQILDHTLMVLDSLMKENKILERQLALISRENSIRWVQNVIEVADTETAAFHPFLELLCMKGQGIVGELWKLSEDGRFTVLKSAVSSDLSMRFTDPAGHLENVSFEFNQEEVDLPWKCMSTMRTYHGDEASLVNASNRWNFKIWSSMGIPMIYSGRVQLVAVLHSMMGPFDEDFISTGEHVATCMGNAYSSKISKKAEKASNRKKQ